MMDKGNVTTFFSLYWGALFGVVSLLLVLALRHHFNLQTLRRSKKLEDLGECGPTVLLKQ